SQGKKEDPEAPDTGQAGIPPLEAFRSALDMGQISVWSWDLRSHQMTWSSNLADFRGPPDGHAEGTFTIAPPDLPVHEGTGLLAAIARTLETKEPCRVEYRVPGPTEREERWLEASATVVIEDGRAVQLLGICRDITERLAINREVQVRARQQEV